MQDSTEILTGFDDFIKNAEMILKDK
jgi:hypothetical protein